MIKKVLNSVVFTCLSATVLLFSGCSENEFGTGNSGGGIPEEPSMLDFATTQTVKLMLNYNIPDGITSTFDIYSGNPLGEDGLLLSSDSLAGKGISRICGGINVSGISELTRVIPSHTEKLYLYSPHLFTPILSYAEVENGVATFSQVNVPFNVGGVNPKVLLRESPRFWSKPIDKFLRSKSDFYAETTNSHYKYDLINPDLEKEIPAEVFNAIALTFPEHERADSRYYKDASMEIKENAEVFISLIHSGAGWLNSISYVVYEGPKELTDLTEDEKMELEIINIFQLADVYTNTFRTDPVGLSPGKYVQLLYKNAAGEYVKEFPAGAKIGWVLNSDGFNEEDFSVKTTYRVYSAPNWNNELDSNTGELIRTIHFAAKDAQGNLYNCFGFEDAPRFDDDCNDLIFHVQSNPITAIDPPEIINPDEDVTKTESLYGILAFEDKWPKRDDYDLNDVVVNYNSTVTYIKKAADTNKDATVKKVEDVFSFTHTGAAYNNAFSYKVNISKSKLKSVKIDGIEYEAVDDGNGFIIDLCPNVAKVIRPFIAGDTATYTVVMEFTEGTVAQKDFASIAAPYNPFITPKEAPKPNTEIHLPMYPPTNRGDKTLFGTADDCSDIRTGLWYVSGTDNQYPFAIHLAGTTSFKIPKESNSIDISYPRYKNWVESNMAEDKNWYLYPGNY